MIQLAMNWDTLAWIEFQKGNFEEAEKYLVASWQLAQDLVAGEHLVETYEKRNKLPRAATVCAVAQRAYGHPGAEGRLREEMNRLRKYLPASSPDPSVALSDMRTVAFPGGETELESSRRALIGFKYPQSSRTIRQLKSSGKQRSTAKIAF